VERIIKEAARINNNRAAIGVGRVTRDLMLPLVLKLVANTKQQREVVSYHIDWDSTDLATE
jgi:hypothetical protein